jgi:hypothetical protein
MYFLDAINYPYRSNGLWGKLLTAFLLMIPIVNLFGAFVLVGYGLKIIRSVLDGEQDLPDFDFVADFSQGIVAAIVAFVYCIPMLVVYFLAFSGNSPNIALLLIYFILSIVTSFMVIAAMTRYAITEDTSALWAVGENLNIVTAHPGSILRFYINYLLFGIIIVLGVILGTILLIIPGIIVGVAAQFSNYYLYARWAEEVGLATNRKRKTSETYA